MDNAISAQHIDTSEVCSKCDSSLFCTQLICQQSNGILYVRSQRRSRLGRIPHLERRPRYLHRLKLPPRLRLWSAIHSTDERALRKIASISYFHPRFHLIQRGLCKFNQFPDDYRLPHHVWSLWMHTFNSRSRKHRRYVQTGDSRRDLVGLGAANYVWANGWADRWTLSS